MKLFDKDENGVTINRRTYDLILNPKECYSTIERIRYLICNLYNNNCYANVQLFTLLMNSDSEHKELVFDILHGVEFFPVNYWFSINEIALKLIREKRMGIKESYISY